MKKPVTKIELSASALIGLELRQLLSTMSFGFPPEHGPRATEMARFSPDETHKRNLAEMPPAKGFGESHTLLPSGFSGTYRGGPASFRPNYVFPHTVGLLPRLIIQINDSPDISTESPEPKLSTKLPPSSLANPPVEKPAISPPVSISPPSGPPMVRATSMLVLNKESLIKQPPAVPAQPRNTSITVAEGPFKANLDQRLRDPVLLWHAPISAESQVSIARHFSAEFTIGLEQSPGQPGSPAQGHAGALALSPWQNLKWWFSRQTGRAASGTNQTALPSQGLSTAIGRGSTISLAEPIAPATEVVGFADRFRFAVRQPLDQPLVASELLHETEVEDQSDMIQQSIDAILAQLSPSDIMPGSSRTSVGTSLSLAVATALTVEYLRRNQPDDDDHKSASAQKFKPACEESESID